MEGGKRQSREELRHDWIQSLRELSSEPFQMRADQLPTLVDLEMAFRRVACGKATGPDKIPGEACHYAPEQCAKATFATMWKLCLFGHEALMHKGGLLVQAYKGKGDPKQCSSFRSLGYPAMWEKLFIGHSACIKQESSKASYKLNNWEAEEPCPSRMGCI